MRSKVKVTWLVTLLAIMLVLTGCSQNQLVLFDASMKMQNVTSYQQQTTMTFELGSSDFDSETQKQIDTAAAFLNNAKLNLNVKTSTNEEKTVAKSQVDMNFSSPGMDLSMPVWVDSDLTGNTPKLLEIVKLPQIAASALPSQFAGKEYMVLNPYDMNGAENNLNLTQLAELTKNMQSQQIDFLNSYAKRFNPQVKVIAKGSRNVQTGDGFKLAKIYEVKLNDKELKTLIKYTVNNFVKDEEAMKFVKEFMHSALELSQDAEALSEVDKAFEEFTVNKEEFLTQFNKVMGQLEDVTLLGNQGLTLDYAIVDGYIVKESGTIDLNVDIAQINKFMNALTEQEGTSQEAKGILSLKVNFSTVTSGINSPVEIQIPAVNEINSFDYMDLMNSMNSNPADQAS